MLDETQRTTLAAHIRVNTDQAVIDALAIGNTTKLAELYNKDSTFIVWREAIQPEEYRKATVWIEVGDLQVGSARIWEWLTENLTKAIDATDTNIRQGIADVFPANRSTRGALLSIAMEAASLVESIYATGTGTEQAPGVRVVVGKITDIEVGEALNENT